MAARIALGAILLAGCGPGSGRPPAEGTVKLRVEGEDREFRVETLEIFELRNELQPDQFEMAGTGFSLVGNVWPLSDFRKEGWESLAGKQFAVQPRGGNPRGRKDSRFALPELGESVIGSGGAVIFEKHERIEDRDVLSGTLWLILDTVKGQKRASGVFRLKARVAG